MLDLKSTQIAHGATLAPDDIPQHFGNIADEYHSATHNAVLMDRSHEGRLRITGASRFDILHRISTNDLLNMAPGEGRGTAFTRANARLIDRVEVYNSEDALLAITAPGRGATMKQFLSRQIFFNDEAAIEDITSSSHQFVVHGPHADEIVASFGVQPAQSGQLTSATVTIVGAQVTLAQRKPLTHSYWSLIVHDVKQAANVWGAVLAAGAPAGLACAGSLAYNMIRIASGQSAFGREITGDYLPLEVGLWDEVSFTKGCYTGQEIIARMESRSRLARVMMTLSLPSEVKTPAPLLADGKPVGTVTSCVQLPDGAVVGIGVVKTALAQPGTELTTENGEPVRLIELAGAAPPATMLGQGA